MDQISELYKIISDHYRKTKNKPWPCFFPLCTNTSIKSHSQSVSSSLKSIAEHGHLVERNPYLLPIREKQGWQKVGIKRATIFPGFCQTHDDRLFKQADSINEKNITAKAVAFLSYRTFAMEMRKKEVYADYLKGFFKHRDKFVDPNAGEGIKEVIGGMLNCLKVTKPFFLRKYQEMIEFKEYSQMAYKIYRSNRNLAVSCATTINPLDITEQPINKPQPLICFNVLPRKKYTLIIFSYPTGLSALIDQFIRDNERLENMIFNYCEEIILNISFYDSLDSQTLWAIDEAQQPWICWQKVNVPDIFDFRLSDKSLFMKS